MLNMATLSSAAKAHLLVVALRNVRQLGNAVLPASIREALKEHPAWIRDLVQDIKVRAIPDERSYTVGRKISLSDARTEEEIPGDLAHEVGHVLQDAHEDVLEKVGEAFTQDARTARDAKFDDAFDEQSLKYYTSSRSETFAELYANSCGLKTLNFELREYFPKTYEVVSEWLESGIRVLGGPGSGNFGHSGRPGEIGGSGEGVSLSSSSRRAFSGKAIGTAALSKSETGKLGEQVTIAYLKDRGFKDARSLNEKGNNYPVDLIQDHEVIEVKAGLVSNGERAQQWRATIGQPGVKEAAWLTKASDRAKEEWNEKKQQAVLDRKAQAIREVSKQVGHQVRGKTIALIINPHTRTVDVHEFKGFHLRIGWKSEEAKSAYRGSFKYKR